MEEEVVIKVNDIGMLFNLSQEKVDNLKEYVIKLLKRELLYQEFWALRHISFDVKKGERMGVIGLNGAGKSTLLKIITGVMKPTEGDFKTKGKIVALLELGAGFDKDYTGRENIYLNGALLGYSKEFIASKFDEIVEFSEIGPFLDVPVKNYSSGMKSRLGFSIAVAVKPDILILDEVLAVGDAKFKKKSKAKIDELLKEDITVLIVSHSPKQVRKMCDRALWLKSGTMMMVGESNEVVDAYEKDIGLKK